MPGTKSASLIAKKKKKRSEMQFHKAIIIIISKIYNLPILFRRSVFYITPISSKKKIRNVFSLFAAFPFLRY